MHGITEEWLYSKEEKEGKKLLLFWLICKYINFHVP